MKPQTKTILIVTGATLIAAAIGIGIWMYFKNKAERERENENGSDSGGNTSGGSGGNTTKSPAVPTQNVDDGTIEPKYNVEGELVNPFDELKGRVLYPKRKEVGGWGYANVRSSTEVNTDRGWWDFNTNLLTTINSGTPIGTVVSKSAATYNDYSYTWYRVKLLKPVGSWWAYEYGYVRADTVTIKPYQK